jgi:TRAP transporter 4TM/12TM fusion protein
MDVKKTIPCVFAVLWLGYQLYLALISPLHPLLQQPLHLLFALFIVFWYYPAGKYWWRLIDGLILAGILFSFYYFASQTLRLQMRIPYVDQLYPIDLAAMIVMVVILLEAVRRVLGYNLLILMLVFIAYAVWGRSFPGWLRFRGISLTDFTELMVMGPDGILGIPLSVSANYLFYFILFGIFFSEYGGGELLLDLGLKLSNKQAGGPAKAAVISSSLVGMVSGSAVANVTTTGVFTIPLMKKIGYRPEQAAAVEAVASTGGQIMPPIMGVGAFIMAEMLGVRYLDVAVSAIIPAVVYYFSIFILVDFLARRNRIGMTAEKYICAPVIPRLYHLIPAFVVVYYIIIGASLMTAALRGTMIAVVIALISKKYRLSLSSLKSCIVSSAKQSATIAVPTAAAGLIIGIVIQSGLATKFSQILSSFGGGNLVMALIMATLGCMILGMALPTVAAYVVAAILFVPALIKLGLMPFSVHMFVFYFGIIAQITPPVCLASFTAAGIAGSDSWKTGWTAFAYASVAFLVPFVFVYEPSMLLQGSVLDTIRITLISLAGTFILAAGIAGLRVVPIR